MRPIFILASLLATTVCWADSAVTLKLTGVNGSSTWNGVYAYPYEVTVQVTVGKSSSTVAMNMMCDDYSDEISINESWQANPWSLTQTGVDAIYQNDFYSPTLFGSSAAAYKAYQEAAYLLIDANSNQANWAMDNAAVWYLFDPNLNGSTPEPSEVSAQLAAAQTFVSQNNPNYSDITVYTPSGYAGGRPQEFLSIDGPGSDAPEPPASLLLAAGGAILIALSALRKARAARAVESGRRNTEIS